MTRFWLMPAFALLPLAAAGQERPLTGAEFEAFVQGRTMDTYNETGIFGVESFLPNRRALWRDSERCLKGTWTEADGIVCYTYEGEDGRFCSSFYDRGGWLIGFADGIWGNDPIMLHPSDDPVTCDDFLGS